LKKLIRRLGILALFAGLVVVLLAFQGILFRGEHEPAELQAAERVAPGSTRAVVERRSLSSTREYSGFVEAIDPADVAPRVLASVLTLDVREGDTVAANDVIARLDDRDARARLAQAEAARRAAQAGAQAAELAFARADRLHDVGTVTDADWEAARAASTSGAAQVEQAEQGVQEASAALAWFEVTAPFDGRVLARHADPGATAMPGRPLVTLYRPDRLRFRVAIPEERAAGLEPGAVMRVAFDGLADRDATLTRVVPGSDPRTGTVVLHLAPGDVTDLAPGRLGRATVASGEREALLVPAAAVERIGQVERVRLIRGDAVESVLVRTGKSVGDLVEVLSGLSAGEEVEVR